MKKNVIAAGLALAAILSNATVVCAAPVSMPDGTVFDAAYYAQNNPDVTAVFGTDENMLYQHYVLYGKQEGRMATEPGATVIENDAPAVPELQIPGWKAEWNEKWAEAQTVGWTETTKAEWARRQAMADEMNAYTATITNPEDPEYGVRYGVGRYFSPDEF